MPAYLRGILIAALALALPDLAGAVSFTVAPGAAGGGGALCALGSADVCNSPANGTNSTYALAAFLGLGAGDVVDALSFNTAVPHPPPFPGLGAAPLQFSVAPGAAGPGLPGVVDSATIYRSAGGGTAVVDITGVALGLAVGDDVDGYENWNVPLGGASAIFFSLAPGSPSLGAFTPGDIFLVNPGGGGFGLFINAESLGLCTIRSGCGLDDDLDALIVNTDAWLNVGQGWPTLQNGNGLLFSVAPGAVGGGLPAGTLPGDVLLSLGGGASVLYAGAAQLGLAAGDNLDALEIVPEPGTLWLVAAGLAGLAARRRRTRP